MEQNVNVWKANLTNGLILGITGIVFTLIVYFLDLTFNKSVGYIFIGVAIILLYFFLRSYRDNYLHGNITYGQSVGAGVIIYLYYSIISAIFIYILYTVIDTGLTNKMLAFVEEEMVKSGKVPEGAMETALAFQKKLLVPEIMAPISLVTNMFYGTVISLLVSIFVKKEGNPLIETTEN
ncbi:MAG: DUF4199 domain-containing protein [Bacteroidales bacterium]|nr:DUF4199 domain-containing protein [Bacteroidales bacterium]